MVVSIIPESGDMFWPATLMPQHMLSSTLLTLGRARRHACPEGWRWNLWLPEGLKVPSNATLIGLPPYAPELNSTETLWHDLRRHP